MSKLSKKEEIKFLKKAIRDYGLNFCDCGCLKEKDEPVCEYCDQLNEDRMITNMQRL